MLTLLPELLPYAMIPHPHVSNNCSVWTDALRMLCVPCILYDMVRMRNPVKRQIQSMVRRIVAEFDPDKIILFGSYARGEAGPDSDVDLLVVMPVKGSKRAKQLEIRAAVHDVHVSKDIVVSRPEEFQWRKDVVGTIEHPAAQEGQILYARQ